MALVNSDGPLPLTMSLTQAAERLGIASGRLRVEVAQRRVPYLLVGRRYRFTEEQLHEIIHIWTIPVVPEAPNPWGRKRRPEDEEARRWAHHRNEPLPRPGPPARLGQGSGFNDWGRKRRSGKSTPPAAGFEPDLPVIVRCPGSGKAVKLDRPTPPRCPSCKREDLIPPRFSPSSGFGLLAAHSKTVAACSKEAALPRWGGSSTDHGSEG